MPKLEPVSVADKFEAVHRIVLGGGGLPRYSQVTALQSVDEESFGYFVVGMLQRSTASGSGAFKTSAPLPRRLGSPGNRAEPSLRRSSKGMNPPGLLSRLRLGVTEHPLLSRLVPPTRHGVALRTPYAGQGRPTTRWQDYGRNRKGVEHQGCGSIPAGATFAVVKRHFHTVWTTAVRFFATHNSIGVSVFPLRQGILERRWDQSPDPLGLAKR